MLKIAICDDDVWLCGELEKFLEDVLKEKCCCYEIEAYYTATKFLDGLKNGDYYDIIFLDIELKANINGVDIGDSIRNELMNQTTSIIYVSSNQNYAMQLFETRPFDFIVKPIGKEKIDFVMSKYLKVFPQSTDVFEYSVKQEIFQIKIQDIMYFESDDRRILIHTVHRESSEPVAFYGSISSVREKLQKYKFLDIHNSYFVNSNYVLEYQYNSIKMIDGRVLPISQNKRKQIRSARIESMRGTDE